MAISFGGAILFAVFVGVVNIESLQCCPICSRESLRGESGLCAVILPAAGSGTWPRNLVAQPGT